MSIPGTLANDQQGKVQNELATQNSTVKETLNIPGIKDLHNKSVEEIAAVLANIIKSRAGLQSLTYNVGQDVQIEYNGNPFNQLRG